MLNNQEVLLKIYQLLTEVRQEIRELNKQYYDLESRLHTLSITEPLALQKIKNKHTLLEQEKILSKDKFYKHNKTAHHIPFDRISKNVLSILKQSPIPQSNKQLLEKLNTEYDLCISYSNLTNNILPKMINERNLPIEKACRGYWQYRLQNS